MYCQAHDQEQRRPGQCWMVSTFHDKKFDSVSTCTLKTVIVKDHPSSKPQALWQLSFSQLLLHTAKIEVGAWNMHFIHLCFDYISLLLHRVGGCNLYGVYRETLSHISDVAFALLKQRLFLQVSNCDNRFLIPSNIRNCLSATVGPRRIRKA